MFEKPLDMLHRAIYFIHYKLRGAYGHPANKPGEVIELMSKDDRKILQELKSSDTQSERIDPRIASEEWHQEQKFRAEKLEFDKKLKLK